MVAPGRKVVVAVSGGPDSLCLLHILAQLRDELEIALHVAHLDHMIRGEEAAAEAQFVAGIAHRWAIPATIEAVDVAGMAQANHTNLHAAARAARYRFLARVARAVNAQAVAVAHHANDQAETVLMHLLRGAGAAGLRGMQPVTPWEEWAHAEETKAEGGGAALIRPLLTVTREAIERYCAAHGLQPRYDPSNQDPRHTRNRIRHELMPLLTEYNTRIIAALGRTAAICAEDHAFLQEALEAAWSTLVHVRADGIDFAGRNWRALHPALQREALRRAHALLTNETLEFEHVEQARMAIVRSVGEQIHLAGGIALTVGYGGSFTIGAVAPPDGPQLEETPTSLPLPGRVALLGGWTLEAVNAPARPPADRWEIYLAAQAIDGPLTARWRRPGDRLQLAGGRGSRRIQDIFVDAKVPRALRDQWPLVTIRDTIVWVVGLSAANGFFANSAHADAVRLRIIPPEA